MNLHKQPHTWRPGARTTCAWALPLLLVVASGQVPATRPAKPLTTPAVRRNQPKTPAATPAHQRAIRKKKSGGCGSKSVTPNPKPAESGPHPHWVCAQSTITADPVWKGQRVKFTFKITNDGEADLKIKAKGG